MEVKIIVATHKKYRMPDDPIYLPLHVGRAGKESIGYEGDDTGDNISAYNTRLCELTGLYWAWKNLNADYIGLVHYRRYFSTKNRITRLGKDKFECVLTADEAEKVLGETNLILPVERKYYIETLWSHYCHYTYGHEKDLLCLKEVIRELHPEYAEAFDVVMNRSHAHMFNMFIMKRELLNQYCEWLFPILFEIDKRLNLIGYSPMEARAAAYFGEFMVDVWNEKQQIPYRELPVLFMEKQNWLVKGGSFLLRKIKHSE